MASNEFSKSRVEACFVHDNDHFGHVLPATGTEN